MDNEQKQRDTNGNIIEQPVTCRICGTVFDGSDYTDAVTRGIARPDECFECWFWQDRIARDKAGDKDEFVIVDGHHYIIGAEPTPQQRRMGIGLGHGGVPFRIMFYDGRFVVSHNLWHQGTIPARWTNALPNNAVFV